jgi:non-ribosomal peptide synthetase component F
LIGLFVNTVIVRTDLTDNPTFRSLLARVRTASLEAYAHQDLPFEKLVEELKPERSLSYTPLFQVMFSLENFSHQNLEAAGLKMSALGIESETSKFDLSLTLMEAAGQLKGSFDTIAIFSMPRPSTVWQSISKCY